MYINNSKQLKRSDLFRRASKGLMVTTSGEKGEKSEKS